VVTSTILESAKAVCKGDTITRLAIADVTGHGKAVSEISQYVYDALKAHM
jgi:hypothetical protein